VAKDHWSQPLYSVLVYTIFFLIAPLTTVILYNIEKNYRIIFNDNGITIKNKIAIGSILFRDKVNRYSWEKVLIVNCVLGDFFDTIFLEFDEKEWGFICLTPTIANIKITLNYLTTNRKDALEFIVTKIPTSKISENAKAILNKKYGIMIDGYHHENGGFSKIIAARNHKMKGL
jgi:hypothetical protein